MDKITFTDATLKTQGYVTIDGTNYDIVDTTYTGGTDLNASTFNTMQDNIAKVVTTTSDGLMSSTDKAKLDKTGLFSLDEVAIGTWIDGKPIYRKVLEFNNVPTGFTQKNHGISNFDKLINCSGYYYNSTWGYIPIPTVTSDNMAGYGIGVADFKSTTFSFNIGNLRSSTNEVKLIVEYIKNS